MKHNVFVIEAHGAPEVIGVVDDNFYIGASKKIKIHKRMVDIKNAVYFFVYSEKNTHSTCPFCNKNNKDRDGFDLAIIYAKKTSSVEIGVFDEFGNLSGFLGGTACTSDTEYEILLKIRSFMPSNDGYISSRVADLGLSGTKYEKIIKEYFLNFSTRESLLSSLSVHRTTVSRAIKKIADVCKVCGY